MNYRHAFHAGNFGDVIKHAVMARILTYLGLKDAAYRVIDTHAGVGMYDLSADEAQRTGEWRDGIGRIIAATPPAEVAALLAPWLEAVASFNDGGPLLVYPGSPMLARRLIRRQDRITAVELHPLDGATLAHLFAGDRHVKVVSPMDGWMALRSFLPPKEARGLVVVDPAFEVLGEMERLGEALAGALRRWATGVYLGWYPIKNLARVDAMHADLKAAGATRLIAVDLWVRRITDDGPLPGAGMVLINPPWTLADELDQMMPWLADTLAQGAGAGYRVLRLADR